MSQASSRGSRPVNLAAGGRNIFLVDFQIGIEMGERMVLDVARCVSQVIELRKIGDHLCACHRKSEFQIVECSLQYLILESGTRIVRKRR